MAICVTCNHRDGFTHLQLGKRERACSRIADHYPVGLPLVTESTQSIQIGHRTCCRQWLALTRCSRDGHPACRQVIDVFHSQRCGTCNGFKSTVTIGVADRYSDGLANLRLCGCKRN